MVYQTLAKLQVQNDNGTVVTLPQLEASEARRTFRVQIAPDRNNQEEFKHLREVTLNWHQETATSKLPYNAAEFSLHQVLFLKLKYLLLVMTLTVKQCKEIYATDPTSTWCQQTFLQNSSTWTKEIPRIGHTGSALGTTHFAHTHSFTIWSQHAGCHWYPCQSQ